MPALALPVLDFELLFSMLPAPHAVLAPDGTVLSLNAAMTSLLPTGTAAILTGQSVTALRAAAVANGAVLTAADDWNTALAAARAGTVQVLQPPQPAAPSSGATPSYWQATLQPVPSADAQYLLLRLLDVTEQLNAQHAAEQAIEQARHEREQFRLLAENQPARNKQGLDALAHHQLNALAAEARATDQRLRERTHELVRSREDFATLADNIAQLTWMADATGRIFWYNRQWYDYTGSTPEAMQGWGWTHAHDPALVEGINTRYLAAVQAGLPWEDTFPLRRHDGQYRWFLSRARPIRDAATGAVLRWFGTNTDVTELRQLQDRLTASEEELRIQAESIPQQVWTARPDGTVDFYNHRTAAYVGVAMEKDDGAHWLNFVHPDDHIHMQVRWEAAIVTQRYYEAEFRLRRYDGQYRWFLGQAQARRAPGGHVLKWYGTNTDVHDAKQVQQQLEAQNARLLRTNEDLDNFVYTASHDLKQPITNMAGIFEELTRTAYFRDPDAVKLISYFERALAQIFSTIDDLGAIVRGQREQQEALVEDVALAPLVADVVSSLQDQVTQSGAIFELDFATYPVIPFVRANLQSLLFNLISNSLKYAVPGRPPCIGLSSSPDLVTGRPILTVQDNGMGIDMERFRPQLFQLFRRFHGHVEGTGMGLYLVNRIVQNHGGRLEVSSAVDEGTTFKIYL